jgi:hypothetical protein
LFVFFLTNRGMAWSRVFSEPDYYRSIDRIKKWPDAKNQRLNPCWPCPRGLPNIENWPKLLFCMEKWKILEPTRQFFLSKSYSRRSQDGSRTIKNWTPNIVQTKWREAWNLLLLDPLPLVSVNIWGQYFYGSGI